MARAFGKMCGMATKGAWTLFVVTVLGHCIWKELQKWEDDKRRRKLHTL